MQNITGICCEHQRTWYKSFGLVFWFRNLQATRAVCKDAFTCTQNEAIHTAERTTLRWGSQASPSNVLRRALGRFSGKYMHSANHTKRITDSRAYARNLEQLREIGSGGGRWKTDGLNSLAFSIVDSQEDRADQETHRS